MLKNYFPEMNVPVPVSKIDRYSEPAEETKAQGPASLFDDENEDITYQQKLKFSEELSFLNSDQLAKVLD
jgi:hypothetical protein